jgi:outer membrane immunogenic protein
MLNKLLISSVAATAMIGTAFAADLPSRKAPPIAYAPPPVFTWTGLYIGVNAGGTWSGNRNASVATVPTFALSPAVNAFPVPTSQAAALATSGIFPTRRNIGFIGGGQIGYNWQMASFLAGVEADIQGVVGSNSSPQNNVNVVDALSGLGFPGNFVVGSASVNNKVNYLGTVRGRLGFLVTPSLLLYGTGGLAYGGVSSTTRIFGANTGFNLGLCCGNPTFASTVTDSRMRVGFALGGGAEWMFAPNWSVKAEYMYYNLGSTTYLSGVNGVVAAGGVLAGTTIYSLSSISRVRFDGHIARVGLNYHFNWGAPGPVVARY